MDRQLNNFERAMNRARINGASNTVEYVKGIVELRTQAERRQRMRRWVIWGKDLLVSVAVAAAVWAVLVVALGYGP